jgi:hypothetical protein
VRPDGGLGAAADTRSDGHQVRVVDAAATPTGPSAIDSQSAIDGPTDPRVIEDASDLPPSADVPLPPADIAPYIDGLPHAPVDGRKAADDIVTHASDARPAIDAPCTATPSIDAGSLDTWTWTLDTALDLAADAPTGIVPCGGCAPDQICVQRFRSDCTPDATVLTICKTVSEACRTQLESSGQRNCMTIPTCEEELCPGASYSCLIAATCGNEAAQASVYCYEIW